MIPKLKPSLGWRELAAAVRPPRDDDVDRFERGFAREMGQRHAVAFPYGRTGLLLLLEAMGLRDHQVICPAYTCAVVAHAIVLSGNRPVFADCREGEFNMDLERAEAAVTDRTGAILPTSLFGHPVDLDRLAELRARHPHVLVIQDCAHSFAAEWKGRPVQREGDAALFGLNVSKTITSVYGGMVTTDDDDLAERLRRLRDDRLHQATMAKGMRRLLYLLAVYPAFAERLYPLVDALQRRGRLDRFVCYYDDRTIDMPGDHLEAMAPVEARVGLVQVGRYRQVVDRRRRAANSWRSLLDGEEGIILPPDTEGATYSHFSAVVDDRSRWEARARIAGVELGRVIDYVVPELPAYASYRDDVYPVSVHHSRTVVNFPVASGPAGVRWR